MPGRRWTAADLPDLTGRSVVVTGASTGLGEIMATELAQAGAMVTLHALCEGLAALEIRGRLPEDTAEREWRHALTDLVEGFQHSS